MGMEMGEWEIYMQHSCYTLAEGIFSMDRSLQRALRDFPIGTTELRTNFL